MPCRSIFSAEWSNCAIDGDRGSAMHSNAHKNMRLRTRSSTSCIFESMTDDNKNKLRTRRMRVSRGDDEWESKCVKVGGRSVIQGDALQLNGWLTHALVAPLNSTLVTVVAEWSIASVSSFWRFLFYFLITLHLVSFIFLYNCFSFHILFFIVAPR